ncbi:ribosomal protein S15 [Spizellomyces punctatus DAOM BR117]|uniref:Ribosomal protein S15 n=1 Tax=Spizellomyces punctatus (strain DAOM BR117) TaxID=645134 RepID=A0A0L0HPG1_SPIPD|nr:ribosomal protein S15 [Spizellomyces punctatus DAOM BR117]KND03291.1 ribosomal protein S15 [Spizellomyces punctatus DAOM BR117]|eukprot:XP_016611330.1 ribosomal protein S15 [Spizellomyces punctatus DAOM BR117]
MSSPLWRLAVSSSGSQTRSLRLPSSALCLSSPSTHFHTSTTVHTRIPALQVRISKKSWEKNQKKIANLQQRLGDKYAEIGRDKRRSPTTTTRSSTAVSQAQPTPPPESKLLPFLATPEKPHPEPIVSGSLKDTLATAEERSQRAAEEAREQGADGVSEQERAGSIRMPSLRTTGQEDVKKEMKLPANVADIIPERTPIALRGVAQPEGVEEIPLPAASGPYYAHGLTPSEAELLFVDAPRLAKTSLKGQLSADMAEPKAEMLRRILSLENANRSQITKFNTERCVQLFGRMPHDTGSPEVQAAIFTVRIQAMTDHLKSHRKDVSTKRQLEKWVSKRMKILKYLRRTDLPKFVETCKAIGVVPDTIRV